LQSASLACVLHTLIPFGILGLGLGRPLLTSMAVYNVKCILKSSEPCKNFQKRTFHPKQHVGYMVSLVSELCAAYETCQH
jgi:hypothetical protein